MKRISYEYKIENINKTGQDYVYPTGGVEWVFLETRGWDGWELCCIRYFKTFKTYYFKRIKVTDKL